MDTTNELGYMYYDQDKKVIFSDTPPEIQVDKERHRASVVVIDSEGKLGFGKFTTGSGDLLIAGGGVEQGETLMEALHREAQEELGCAIRNIRSVGVLFQYAEYNSLLEKQQYHCFLADIDGEKFEPEFTEREIEHGLSVVWLDFDEAVNILEKQRKNGGTETSLLCMRKIKDML